MKPSKERRIKMEAQLAEDFRWLAETPQGKRILSWMFGWGMVFQEIDESDPIRLAMAVAENNFAKRIARYCTMNPEVFSDAMKQNNEAIRAHAGSEEFNEMMRSYLGFADHPNLN